MKIHCRWLPLALTAVLALSLSSCSRSSRIGPPAESLTVALPALEQGALLYVADSEGFFTRQGLNVVLQEHETGVTALEALLKGEADIAQAAEYPFVSLALRGEPVLLVGASDEFENDYLVLRQDRGIRTPADLKGKRIGVARGTIAEFYLGRLLELHGLSPHNVTIVDLEPKQSLSELARGDVDAVLTWQPHVAQIQREVAGTEAWSAHRGQAVYAVLAARRAWVDEHASVLERFLRALAEAEDYLVRHPEAAQEIVRERLQYDPAYLAGVWPQHSFSLSLDQPLVIAMKDEAQWMIRNGLTTATALPDFGDFVHPAALEAVDPGAVSIVR